MAATIVIPTIATDAAPGEQVAAIFEKHLPDVAVDKASPVFWAKLGTLLHNKDMAAARPAPGRRPGRADPAELEAFGVAHTAVSAKVRALLLPLTGGDEGRYWGEACSAVREPTDSFIFAPDAETVAGLPAPIAARVGKQLYPQDMGLLSVELSPNNLGSWMSLGLAMGKAAPYFRETSKDGEYKAGPHFKALATPLVFRDKELTAAQCLVCALHIKRSVPQAWMSLGMVLTFEAKIAPGSPQAAVSFEDRQWAADDCFAEGTRLAKAPTAP